MQSLALFALAACLPAQRDPLRDRGLFPLGVWLQAPERAARYRDLSINLYVGLYKGPTEKQLDVLRAAKMPVICAQNEVGLAHAKDPIIVGWMQRDEPDNAQAKAGGGYGPPVDPARIAGEYRRMKKLDPDRPVLLNLGQGVAWDGWYGRGSRTNHPEDYPRYVEGCDIASFDIYPVTHDRPDVRGRLELVAEGVRRLRQWAGSRPVWAFIETTRVKNENALPTPSQIRSEVWLAIASGASGIVYFVHEFRPRFIEAGIFAHPEIAAAVRDVNREILALAPVLREPPLEDAVEVEGDVALRVARRDGRWYLFAVSLRPEDARASFRFCSPRNRPGSVEVIGEDRSIDLEDGRFEDRFESYAPHLYRSRK
ncbi:MAG: hypothetical protein Fur0037_17410 [Planctomycetota bacterium]